MAEDGVGARGGNQLHALRSGLATACGSLPHAETPALFCRALERFIAGLPESD